MPGATVSFRIQAGLILTFSLCFIVAVFLSCFVPERPKSYTTVLAAASAGSNPEPIQPLVMPSSLDPQKVQLGRELFHDPRLSADNSISCASCHDLRTAGTDLKTVSEGIHHRHGMWNAPTVYNSGMNYRQFWDGRAVSLEEQVDGPIQTIVEMGSTWEAVVRKLRQDSHYAAEFSRLYSERIQPASIRDALATFERSLVTPGCRFDRFLQGEKGAISSTELSGYVLFKSLGCISCHQGRNVGGGMMQPFGVLKSPYPTANKTQRDGTNQPENTREMLYKVPSLRNVARTAPYFHDGSTDSLPEAIRIMSDAQLCRHLSDKEVQQIVAFLQSLTGVYESRAL